MGVGSNLIVRDGGIRAVVIRLGRGFNAIDIQGDRVLAGVGSYRGYTAVGIQFKSLASNGNTAWGAGVTTTGQEWGVQVGMGFKWK